MKQRIYSLDILRGVAAMSVFFTHLGNDISETSILHTLVKNIQDFQHYFLWCNGGIHWAVIVFIVLSGFCIHMPSAEKGVKRIIIPYYAVRRFFRIYPVLIVAIVFGLLVFSINNTFDSSSAINLLGNLSLLSGMFNYFPAPLGNRTLITVIVECLLYAIYPFILPRYKTRWVYLLVSVLCVHFVNFSLLIFTKIDATWLQSNLFSFALYWWIGAFFAEIAFNREEWNVKLIDNSKIIISICIAYIAYVVMCHCVNFKGSHVFKSLYLAVMAGLFIFGISLIERKRRTRERTSKVTVILSKVGEYSYSLYVVHLPILSLLCYFVGGLPLKNTALFYFTNIASVIIGTIIFYNIVEKPSHKYAIKLSNRVKV